jgi:hypothetical protein
VLSGMATNTKQEKKHVSDQTKHQKPDRTKRIQTFLETHDGMQFVFNTFQEFSEVHQKQLETAINSAVAQFLSKLPEHVFEKLMSSFE